MNLLKKSVLLWGISFCAASMAAPNFHHHRHGVGLGDDCGSTVPAICIKFIGDDTLVKPVNVTENSNIIEGGASHPGSDTSKIGLYNYDTDEYDLSDIKSYKVTSIEEYFSNVAGKDVDHLCDVTITNDDLQKPQQITMTLHSDGAGNFTCQRS